MSVVNIVWPWRISFLSEQKILFKRKVFHCQTFIPPALNAQTQLHILQIHAMRNSSFVNCHICLIMKNLTYTKNTTRCSFPSPELFHKFFYICICPMTSFAKLKKCIFCDRSKCIFMIFSSVLFCNIQLWLGYVMNNLHSLFYLPQSMSDVGKFAAECLWTPAWAIKVLSSLLSAVSANAVSRKIKLIAGATKMIKRQSR